jgi:hypothetical protein
MTCTVLETSVATTTHGPMSRAARGEERAVPAWSSDGGRPGPNYDRFRATVRTCRPTAILGVVRCAE